VSIAALERARQVADVARLSLLVEVETLRGIVTQGAATMPAAHPKAAAPASAPILEASADTTPRESGGTAPMVSGDSLAPIIGGRTVAHTVAGLLEVFGSNDAVEFFSPRAVRDRLGCSETTAHRLLGEACEARLIERAGRGAYRLCAP
jgi:hypothetical protein